MAPTMPSNQRDHKRAAALQAAARAPLALAISAAESAAWEAVVALRRQARAGSLVRPAVVPLADATLTLAADGSWELAAAAPPEVRVLLDLYLPLLHASERRRFVIAHLAQSLDGRIATAGGASQWLTGEHDLLHTHRLRALADAVVVGAGTVRQDDPRLTVRHCEGDQPVRVVLDPNLALASDRQVFCDDAGETLVVAAADCAAGRTRLGAAEIVALPRAGNGLAPQAVCAALAARGLHWIFIEGGGVTVSRFLAADALDRLQIAVSPVILGSGRPSLLLPEIGDLASAMRPRVRRFPLGPDMLVECILHD